MTTLLCVHASRSARDVGYAILAASIALLGTGYADIHGFDSAGFTLNGNAQATNADGPNISGGVLTLTSALDSQATSAFFNEPQAIENFTASFTYDFLNGSSNPEGGFAFVLQNVGPNALGASGAGLGYEGIGSSLAVMFNIHNTDGLSLGFRGFVNHFDVVQLQLTGENPVHIRIDHADFTLGVQLTDTVTGATEKRFFEIGQTQFYTQSNTAYVGFTGGTGQAYAAQRLSDFSFTTGTGFASGAGSFRPVGFQIVSARLSPSNQVNLGGGTDASRLENITEAESMLSSIDGVTAGVVSSRRIFDRINNSFVLGGDQFAVSAEGYVDLNGDGMDGDTGIYNLYVNSNDGFRLRLNDQLTGEFEGLTDSSDTTISNVALKDGDRLKLTFFSSEGDEELVLRVNDVNGPFVGSAESGITIWPTPVPEPGSAILLGLGAVAIASRRRSSRSHSVSR